jgi:hypothetical protein
VRHPLFKGIPWDPLMARPQKGNVRNRTKPVGCLSGNLRSI